METSGEIGLEYDVERTDKGLRISYRVTNEAGASIFLTTPLPSENDIDTPDPGRVYTYLDEQGLLHMTKRLWEIPDDVDVYAPEVPRWTEVPAGCQFEEVLTLSTPVRMHHPYTDEVSGQTKTLKEVQGFVFSVGYSLSEDAAGLSRQTAEVEEGIVVDYVTCGIDQHLLEGEMVGVAVAIEMSGEVAR